MRPITGMITSRDQRVDDLPERRADDDADREVDDVALGGELPELGRETHACLPRACPAGPGGSGSIAASQPRGRRARYAGARA